jgi:hypothetical protein
MRGSDLHAPSIEPVENASGGNLLKLQVVRLNDAKGTQYPQVVAGNPNIAPNFGILIDAIADGAEGRAQVIGFLECVDTSAFEAGDTLYSTNAGLLSTTINQNPIARVIVKDAENGVLYVNALATGGGGGGFPSWEVDGNNGTDEDVNFLGTTDEQGLQIKTNDENRAFISSDGNTAIGKHKPSGFFHLKNHDGFDESGEIKDTAAVATTDTGYNLIYAYTVPNNSTVIIKASLTGS